MATIVVQLERSETHATHSAAKGKRARDAWAALHAMGRQFGFTARAMHPGTADPDLATYAVIDECDDGRAASLAALLRQTPGVCAAFVKPADAMP